MQPVPILDRKFNDSDDHYSIQVLKWRWRGCGKNRQREYLVHWIGYPDSQNSWIPEDQLDLDDDDEDVDSAGSTPLRHAFLSAGGTVQRGSDSSRYKEPLT